jgi:hypothetical protein
LEAKSRYRSPPSFITVNRLGAAGWAGQQTEAVRFGPDLGFPYVEFHGDPHSGHTGEPQRTELLARLPFDQNSTGSPRANAFFCEFCNNSCETRLTVSVKSAKRAVELLASGDLGLIEQRRSLTAATQFQGD